MEKRLVRVFPARECFGREFFFVFVCVFFCVLLFAFLGDCSSWFCRCVFFFSEWLRLFCFCLFWGRCLSEGICPMVLFYLCLLGRCSMEVS